MVKPFVPDAEELPIMEELETLAEVTADDLESAADKWRKNPPSAEYEAILDADEVSDG